MKTYLTYLTSIALFCCCTLFAQKPVQTYKRLQVNGSHVTAENGEKISLAGMSLFWSIAGDVTDFYNAETIEFLANNWGVSIIRAAMGVNESWDGGRGYIDNPSLQKAKIKKVIDAAIANDIYVIVDWHSHDAENYTTQAVQFFSEIAEEYGDNDHIIYEIYNEPIWQPWSTIKSYSETVIAAIRAKDPDNLIIVGSREWSQRVDEAAANPISDSNLAYTLHFYAGTHKQSLRDRAAQAMRDGIAIFVTEWGTVSADGNGGVDTAETDQWVKFMQDNFISHANWSVSDKNESSGIILSGKGINGLKNGELSTSGEILKDLISDQRSTLSTNDFNFANNTLTVFPNPTSDIVTIPNELKNEQFMIADLSGTVLESFSSENETISFSKYPAGIYILQLRKEGKVISSGLVMKN